MTALTTFPRTDRAAADSYAEEIGGYVDEHYNEYGTLAVCHTNPEGLAVRLWSCITLPEGTTLQRRDSIRVGDSVVSSHSGKRRVVDTYSLGTVGPGTVYLTLEGINGPEAYPGDSMIPVVSRAAQEQVFEYAAFLVDSNRMVGLGPTESEDRAKEDVRAWRKDGFDAVKRRRRVGAWEDDN